MRGWSKNPLAVPSGALKLPCPRKAIARSQSWCPGSSERGRSWASPGNPLKLPFPRQAGRKGYCEHPREFRSSIYLDRQRVKAIARDPTRPPEASEKDTPWRPKASKTRVLSLDVPFPPCWSRKTFVGSPICHFARFAFSPLPVKRNGRARKKNPTSLPSRPPETPGPEARIPKREPRQTT